MNTPQGYPPALRARVLERVRVLLVENLRVDRAPDEIDPDAVLFGTGLGLDSVDAMELLVAVEAAFGLRLDDAMSDPHFFRTVNAVVDIVLQSGGDTVQEDRL